MSSSSSKPEPLVSTIARPQCPVCGKPTYSRAGIHPQCAMVAADEVSSARISAQVAAAPKPTTVALRSFERLCPKCKAVQHVRRRSCECGHVL